MPLSSSDRFRSALRAADTVVWDLDLQTGEGIRSGSSLDVLGIPSGAGDDFARLVHPQDRPRVDAALAAAYAGEAAYDIEFRITRPDGQVRWIHEIAEVYRNDAGQPVRLCGVTVDITARKEAEQRHQLLALEVDHRARNLLTVVLSILRLSRATDIEAYKGLVQGRVMALARAHSLLAVSHWTGADLGRLVTDELAPHYHNEDRVTVSGPEVNLQPVASQSLALALHELATNATKYGALAVPAGRVAVSWEVITEGLTLRWRESGGPVVRSPPSSEGFGSTLLTTVAQQLEGRVALDWRPEGLHATLFVPIAQLTQSEASVAGELAPSPSDTGISPAPALTGRRVLVVEDEPLVAMLMHETLTGAGSEVVGPAATLDQALALAESEPLDAAVLDRNLAGVSSEPVAKLLGQRGVPFAVVTGYADPGSEFGAVRKLIKPIEPDELCALVTVLIAQGSVPPAV